MTPSGGGSYDDGDWVFDPALAGINRRLQQEFRSEAQAVEYETAEYEERLRTLVEWVREVRNRGDVLLLQTRNRSFKGTVTYVGRDFLTVESFDSEADISLAAVAHFRIVDRGQRGGGAHPDGPGTFEMRMLERKGPVQMEFGQALIDDFIQGRLVTVGQDHLIIENSLGEEMVLPLSNVIWAVSRRRGRIR